MTNTGYHRTNNEDCAGKCEKLYEGKPVGIYVVCDGIGGYDQGEVASAIAVDESMRYFFNLKGSGFVPDRKPEYYKRMLKRAIFAADNKIKVFAKMYVSSNLGTTLTCVAQINDKFYFGNAGDSRGYLLHGGNLEQVTEDHNIAYRDYKAGLISKDEMLVHPYKNYLDNALGAWTEAIYGDIYVRNAVPGDIALLCSDGLNTMLYDREIEAILADDKACLADKGKFLVDGALLKGGDDNITIALVQVV
jgi:protein phosphatase